MDLFGFFLLASQLTTSPSNLLQTQMDHPCFHTLSLPIRFWIEVSFGPLTTIICTSIGPLRPCCLGPLHTPLHLQIESLNPIPGSQMVGIPNNLLIYHMKLWKISPSSSSSSRDVAISPKHFEICLFDICPRPQLTFDQLDCTESCTGYELE